MLGAGLKGYSGSRGVLGALRARAPRPELAEELLALPTADACINRLRTLPILAERAPAADRAQLERELRNAVLVLGRRLARFVGGPARAFLDSYLVHYQIDNLTVLFRASLAPVEDKVIERLYSGGPIYGTERELALLDSPEKVIAFAERSPLETMAQEAFAAYTSANKDLFQFELSLNRQWFQLLWDAAGRLTPFEEGRLKKRILLPYIGANALAWALWLERYHGVAVQEMVNLLPIPRQVMTPEVYTTVATAENVRAAAKVIRGAPLRNEIAEMLEESPEKDVSKWHRLASRMLWRTLRERDLGPRFDVTTLLTAIMRWEFIIDDAITVMTGKAVNMPRESIEPLLVTMVP